MKTPNWIRTMQCRNCITLPRLQENSSSCSRLRQDRLFGVLGTIYSEVFVRSFTNPVTSEHDELFSCSRGKVIQLRHCIVRIQFGVFRVIVVDSRKHLGLLSS